MTGTEKHFDVVVVGCGIAGLAAAVSARQSGASVAVLERAPVEERGGNTRYTEAFIRMKSESEVADDFEESFMSNAGCHLDPALVALTAQPRENWPPYLKSLSFVDPDIIATFAASAGPTIAWLKECGARFEVGAPNTILTLSAPRIGTHGGGLGLIEALAATGEAAGIEFFYETTAQTLVVENDEVRGIVAHDGDGRTTLFRGAVVLGCGGFEGNPEMTAQYLGPRAVYLRPVARGGWFNRGEGIRMALDIGAAPCGDFGSYHAEPIDPRSGKPEPAIFTYPYGILVNQEGRRFIDEAPGTTDMHYENTARQILQQTNAIAYMIFDQRIEDVPNRHRAIRTDLPPVDAPTVSELAAKLKIPPATLERTVADYNAACPEGGSFNPLVPDGLAADSLDPPKSNWSRRLDAPPYLAYPLISANTFTFGGLKVNQDAQVVRADGGPIPGLYAAGETMGLYYRRYTGATSVLRGAVFGRIAGLHASHRPTREAA